MPENSGEGTIGRRGVFKKALVSGLGAAVALDATIALRGGSQTHEVTPAAEQAIKEAAQVMAKHISTDFILHTLTTQKDGKEQVIEARFNRDAIAYTIACLGYLDGGQEELAKVTKFVRENNVDIRQDELPEGLGGRFISPFDGGSPLIVFPKHQVKMYFEGQPNPHNEYVFRHELWHLVQQARDPEGYKKLSIGGDYGVAIATSIGTGVLMDEVFLLTEKVLQKISNTKQTRRGFLLKAARFGAVTANAALNFQTGLDLARVLSPEETQAYLQIGDGSFKGVMDQKALDPLRGKLMTFKPK